MIDNPQRIRVLCVDDHPVVQQGIPGLLAAEPDVALVAEAANRREGNQQFRALQAGDRGCLFKNALHKELLDTSRAVHTGRKALASEVTFELAERATDDALTMAEIRIRACSHV